MAKKAKSCPRITKGNMGARERKALAKVLKPLVREGICNIKYDSRHDVFYFRGKSKLATDVRKGFVLSVSDAQHGAWQTIHERPSHDY
jgi:hypothetical protein